MALAQALPAPAAEIVVYEHASFRGRSLTLEGPVLDLTRADFNDRISSVHVVRGTWEACEHKDFGGRCEILRGDVRDLSDMRFNDTISSLRPVSEPDYRDAPPRRDPDRDRPGEGRRRGITLYEHKDYRGRSESFLREVPDLREARFDDASSLVVGRESWEICDRAYYRGRCQVVSSDVANLTDLGMNDRVRSMRPVDRDDRRDDRPPTDNDAGGLTLYTRPEFGGSRRTFRHEESNLSDADFNDVASSASVGSQAWELCEHADFRGRCVVIDRDARDLSALGLGNKVSSIRPVDRRGR